MPHNKNCLICHEKVCRLQCASFIDKEVNQTPHKQGYKRRKLQSSVNIEGAVFERYKDGETYKEVEDSRA